MASSPSGVQRTDVRLREVLRASGDEAAAKAMALVRDLSTPELDDSLIHLVVGEHLHPRIQELACRVLAERDRDRDPQPLVDAISMGSSTGGAGRGLVAEIANPPLIVLYSYGFNRLRRLHPIEECDALLSGDYGINTRVNATIALGDTWEAEALTPLIRAIRDHKPIVRAAAADAVRRIVNAGTQETVRDHEINNLLIDAMRNDVSKRVRISALRAIATTDSYDKIVEFPAGSLREKIERSRVQGGKIHPLKRTWPGDQTVG